MKCFVGSLKVQGRIRLRSAASGEDAHDDSKAQPMASKRTPYRQTLPPLELSMERYTDAVLPDGRWHLFRAGQEIGSYRTKAEAQAAWRAEVEASDWKPSA